MSKVQKVATTKTKKPANTKKTEKAIKMPKEKSSEQTLEKVSKKRHFIITYNDEVLTASPSGDRPKQAANKALTAIIKKYNTNGNLLNKEIFFTLTERKKQKKDNNGNPIPNRIFRYIGTRTKIDVNDPKYTDAQKAIVDGVAVGIKIPHTMFIKCNKCKQNENKLIQEAKDKGEKLTKKSIPKNENCKECRKEEKPIVYEFTNKVRMAPKEEVKAEKTPKKAKEEPAKKRVRKTKEDKVEKKEEPKVEIKEEPKVEEKEIKKPARKNVKKSN